MNAIKPGVLNRAKAAWRILFRTGDNMEVCSFCANDRWHGHHIVVGPGVAICIECAKLVVKIVEDETKSAD
jgi:ClpX C4-type zinc finger